MNFYMDKLTELCQQYDMNTRRLAILSREAEEKKQENRDLYEQIQNELNK